MKLTRGTFREDGYRFWHYSVKGGVKTPVWLSPEKFLENKERVRKAMAASRKANPEHHRIKRSAAYKSNPDPYRNAVKRWAARNPHISSHNRALRRARLRDALDQTHDVKLENALVFCKERVQKCVGVPHHIDHIVPLSRGGKHHHTNLQILPEYWNLRKGARPYVKLPDCYKTFNQFPSGMVPKGLSKTQTH